MARTFIASDQQTGQRKYAVEARPDLDEGEGLAELEQFKRRLYDGRIHAGLLITPKTARFVSDTFKSLEFSSDSYEVMELPTETLFKRVHEHVEPGEAFYLQVRKWLDAVNRSWWRFVPDEALPMVLSDVIGGLAHADLGEYGDVLDAAE